MIDEPLDWTALAFFPEVGRAVLTFREGIQGPYVLRVPGMVRRGDLWVECEAVMYRRPDGIERYEAHPIPHARTLSLKVGPVSEQGTAPPSSPEDPPRFSGTVSSAFTKNP